MTHFKDLHNKIIEMDKESNHKAYYYKVSDALTIMVCGMLSNLQTISDIHEWARSEPVKEFLLKEFGIRKIPSRAQFYNLIKCISPEKFNKVFVEWADGCIPKKDEDRTIAIDGKTVCSTDKLTEDNSFLHIMSAVESENNLVLCSLPCKTKIGEPEILRQMVEMLDINGAVVVADALHCNKRSAEKIIKENGDYLFVVKDNNPNLKENIEYYFQNEKADSFSKKELNGGRIEKRTAYTTTDIDWLPGIEEWAALKAIGAICTEFEKSGQKSREWHYYISSKELTPESLLKHARLEWAVESMHWLLDVHFLEDKTKVWDMNVQQNLNIMRKIALNLAREYKNRFEPRKAISGILKCNLFDINNLVKFIRDFVALINVSAFLQN